MQYYLESKKVLYNPKKAILAKESGDVIYLSNAENALLNCLLTGMNGKNEIIDTIWPGVYVTENSYHKLIFDLRQQFKLADLDPKSIKTLPRRGCIYSGVIEKIENAGDEAAGQNTTPEPEKKIDEPATPAVITPKEPAEKIALPVKQATGKRLLNLLYISLAGLIFGSGTVMTFKQSTTKTRQYKNYTIIESPGNILPDKFADKKFVYFYANNRIESYLICETELERKQKRKCSSWYYLD